jgi:plastocyanin
MLACLFLTLGAFRLRTVFVLSMPAAEAASKVEPAEPRTSRGRPLYSNWFEILKTAACPISEGRDQRLITFRSRTASCLWSEDKKMTRFSVILISVAMCAFAVPNFAQHHKLSKQTDSSPASASGPLSSATVTFGGFMSQPKTCPSPPCPVLDRFPTGGNTTAYNHHGLTPEVTKISVGGTVNFVISGFHVISIYDDGTLPEDIDKTILVPPSVPGGPPRAIPIIDDAENRIYRGLDPALLPAGGLRSDRVEAVKFDTPGLYLVICAVVSHFEDGMYGYVRVLPAESSPALGFK